MMKISSSLSTAIIRDLAFATTSSINYSIRSIDMYLNSFILFYCSLEKDIISCLSFSLYLILYSYELDLLKLVKALALWGYLSCRHWSTANENHILCISYSCYCELTILFLKAFFFRYMNLGTPFWNEKLFFIVPSIFIFLYI